MSEQPMPARLREGIDAAKRGDKTAARRLLQQVLSTDGDNEIALMWMASVVDAMEERRFFLERALKVNPNNARAREALRRLGVADPQSAAARTRTATANRAARPLNAPNTNLYLIAAAIVAVVVIALIIISAVSSLQPPPTTPTSLASGIQSVQLTATARLFQTQTPTPDRRAATATTLPGIIVTLDMALIPTLPPTFTPTFTPPATETLVPTPTPIPLSRFNMIYSDVEANADQASLYQARGDGTGEEKLASGSEGGFNDVDYDPSSGRIVFVGSGTNDGGDPSPELFIASLDAPTEGTQLTTFVSEGLSQPSWSPDGESIVFCRDQDGDVEVWIVNADGSGLVALTNNEGADDCDPQFSPDGDLIVYTSDVESPGFSQLYTMTTSGSEKTPLTNVPISSDAAWSPDGQRIAFVNNQQGDDDIYVMDANGQRSFLVTVDDNGAVDRMPVWAPNGEAIYFASNRDGEGFRWYVTDLQGNAEPITVSGREPQTLSFITN
ncbi:MAG: hypothetical protein ABI835_00365 [Chloroflexota bacterium]